MAEKPTPAPQGAGQGAAAPAEKPTADKVAAKTEQPTRPGADKIKRHTVKTI